MLEASGGVSASQPRPMTDAEEIHDMKLQIQAARRAAEAAQAEKDRQAQLSAAAADTKKKKQAADTALNTYHGKMLAHQNQWVNQNRGKYKTQAAAQQAWLTAWENSDEGKAAEKELAPYLDAYNSAVRKELRLSAADADANGGDVKGAVQAKANDLKSGGNGFQAKVLDGIVDTASTDIGNEFAALRNSIVDVYNALDQNNQALVNQKNTQDRLDQALQGVHNMGLRAEIRDSFAADIKAAQTAVDDSAKALKDAEDKELAITLSENVLADQLKVTGRDRRDPDFQQAVRTAQQQYQDALAGKFDLKEYSPDQLQAALSSVLANHPELLTEQNRDFAMHLMEVGNALRMRPTLDANLDMLSIGKNSPQWMQDLVARGDKVTAALIVSLGVQNAQPQTKAEEILAENDPLAFAMLKYAGGPRFDMPPSSIDNVQPDTATVVQAGEAAAAAAFSKLRDSLDKTDQAKVSDLQGLLLAAGNVRADYIQQQWQQFVALHSPKQSLDQILNEYLDNKDFNDPNAKPTSDMGKFIQVLQVNMNACITPEQQTMIWDKIGADFDSYVNQQADYIAAHYGKDDFYAAAIGEWQKQMGQFAPGQVADLVINATTTHFDASLVGKHGGGRMVDGLQILADRSPQSAGKIATWVTTATHEKYGYQVPIAELLTVKQDGTGVTLGAALLGQLQADGADKYALENLQSTYDYSLHDAQTRSADAAGKVAFDRFEEDHQQKLQQIFDSAIKDTGDLYTSKHQFGNDPVADNKYGDMLHLTADNPNAGTGQAKYTDPAKLAKIHELKQIDLLSQALHLPVDLTSIISAIANGDKLPESDNLEKINQARDWIKDVGGDNALVTFIPTVYNSPGQGPVALYLMRVEGDKNNDGVITRQATTQTAGRGHAARTLDDEDMIIDTSNLGGAVDHQNVAWKFGDFKAFQEQNNLDDHGKLYMSSTDDMLLHDANGDHHVDNINFAGTDAAITTAWEHITNIGDKVAAVAGATAGVALIFTTGGLAAPLVLAATSGYFLLRTVQNGTEMAEHGQSFQLWNPHANGAIFGVFDPARVQFLGRRGCRCERLGGIASPHSRQCVQIARRRRGTRLRRCRSHKQLTIGTRGPEWRTKHGLQNGPCGCEYGPCPYGADLRSYTDGRTGLVLRRYRPERAAQ